MARDRIVFPTPNINQAMSATVDLARVYNPVAVEIEEANKPRTDLEAAEKLEALAVGVMRGEVMSHRDIAIGVNSLGSRIGPFGATATEIDFAAHKLVHAVRTNYPRIQHADLITKKTR